MQIPHDFPPVPKCFSHLLNAHIFYNTENESEDQTLSQSLPPTRHVIPELNHSSFGRSLSDNSQPHSTSLTTCYNSEGPTTSTTIGGGGGGSGSLLFYPYQYQDVFSEDGESQKLKTPLAHSANFMSPCTKRRMIMKQQSSSDLDSEQVEKECRGSQDLSNPFVKLNSSLEKLQKEMRELRLFDVSLFYQLLSLHESIQDIKFNINDRYSETGSECSLGSASYMGSMSSLDEESDWGESQVFLQSFRGEESAAYDDENRQSTSSLLEQITALTQKAEEDI